MEYKKHPEINAYWIDVCKEFNEYSGKTDGKYDPAKAMFQMTAGLDAANPTVWLATNASAVAGEEVRLTCGPEGEWDNRNLQELTLPAFLTDVHNYALYGCRSLHTLYKDVIINSQVTFIRYFC